jgi:hypothetical protein
MAEHRVFVAEPVTVGMFSDVNQRSCQVAVTSPSGFLEISREGETRLLLDAAGARDLVERLMRGIALVEALPAINEEPSTTTSKMTLP